MVKSLKILTTLIFVSATLCLVLQGMHGVGAHPYETQNFLSVEYGGVSIRVDASKEAIPGGSFSIAVVINATADGVRIEHLNLSVYGFINGEKQTMLNSITFLETTLLPFNETSKFDNMIVVPSNVWGLTYGQISLRYAIKDLPSTERNPGFPLTTIRNVYLEDLESQLQNLNQTHSMLSKLFKNLTMEYANLDATYTELQDARTHESVDLYSMRTVVTILMVTTVFFIATTLYLTLRRPRNYW